FDLVGQCATVLWFRIYHSGNTEPVVLFVGTLLFDKPLALAAQKTHPQVRVALRAVLRGGVEIHAAADQRRQHCVQLFFQSHRLPPSSSAAARRPSSIASFMASLARTS